MSGITVHYLANSRSQRILWLLEELGVPYEVKRYERLPTLLAPPELLKVHPLGKSPVITDGEVVVAESGAIVEYILTKYGKGKALPPDAGWVDNLYCMCAYRSLLSKLSPNVTSFADTHYPEGTLMPLRTEPHVVHVLDLIPVLPLSQSSGSLSSLSHQTGSHS